MIRAGTPTTVAPSGTERTTTLPEPMRAPSPTTMFPRMHAFEPTTTFGAELRMALRPLQLGAAEDHTFVQQAPIADPRGLPDDHAHAVIDDDAPAQRRTRVDLDPGEKPAGMPDHARGQAEPVGPQGVRHPVHPHRVHAGIDERDLERRARGRIVLEDGVDVVLRALPGTRHTREPTLGSSEHPAFHITIVRRG